MANFGYPLRYIRADKIEETRRWYDLLSVRVNPRRVNENNDSYPVFFNKIVLVYPHRYIRADKVEETCQ